ncbi:hypothetical protein FQN53_002962 [Emmonsiellopsis sp. PD_33]|nr:hypothetical protein FQN53_002962 [Emmonsiellopsis sp. PD_33]
MLLARDHKVALAPGNSTDDVPSNGSDNSGTAICSDSSFSDNKQQNTALFNDQDAQREREVLNLARQFTTGSVHLHRQNPFVADRGGPLDPNGPNFKARDWAKAFYNIRTDPIDGYPSRVSGVAFRNLSVFGYGSTTDYQKTVGNAILKLPSLAKKIFGIRESKIDILHDFDGLVRSGEMLAVLGPPGSGCSTLLRTIAGDTHGFNIASGSSINYQGIPPEKMSTQFRGEAIYTAEVDAHFPMLSVGDTLYFAAMARTPYTLPRGIQRQDYARHLRDVIMAMFGISHTVNTQVGDQFVRGVSGGERKRVTIAEAALSYAPLQCWDNSTRGLDSSNSLSLVQTLRTQSDIFGATSCVSIYQAPQAAYELFDKVTVLYEGRQIFFGKKDAAKSYFERLGFVCRPGETTPDFLTSMTSPAERIIRPGFENLTPRTAEDFARQWKLSQEYHELMREIEAYNEEHKFEGENYEKFNLSRKAEKSTSQREKSPYTLSYLDQTKLCMWREFQKLKKDPSVPIAMLVVNFFEAIILASVFYNLPRDTSSFFHRGAAIFLVIVLNAFGSVLEVISLYAKRTIVEKHNRYALCHPSAEALSSMLMDLPYKTLNSIIINTTLYFMSNLRREPGPFFFFFLVSFTVTLTMSTFIRFISSITKTLTQALAPVAIILFGFILYTGFAVPTDYVKAWAIWIPYINPVAYGFESIMVNEFHGQEFECSSFVPSGAGYENVIPSQKVCSVAGATPGSAFVSGTAYLQTTFQYENSHRWRNFAILVGMTIFLGLCHLIAADVVASERSKGEVLVFRRGKMQKAVAKQSQRDEERVVASNPNPEKYDSGIDADTGVERQTSTFHWQDVCYDIDIKGQPKRLLDHVDGWVKPGTLTALMGVSGAGKTTLLDVLASRTTIGVVTGDMLVDGQQRDRSFQQKTGYVQQQDLHLHTSTVREALEFSALLRQPDHFTKEEKLDYVDKVINLLNMTEYADAIVGVPGEGLNVEQRKRLTIGVELAARPKLLLFLDEPSSGLDSQTSASIAGLMEKLTRNGQAILCTIHQPSAVLFQRFDRLLLLARGGQTVYFGEIGRDSRSMIDYFVRNGAPEPLPDANPAEYMLEVIGAAPGAHTEIDWPATWRESQEYKDVQNELARLKRRESIRASSDGIAQGDYKEFAAPFWAQTMLATMRVFQQYWRTPSYIYPKALLMIGCQSTFISFSFFKSENTIQGLQNQMFGIFVFLLVVIQLIFQITPEFVPQRALFEARERQSKTYDWKVFMISNIVVELVWNSFVSVFCYLTWYYPMGLWRNAEATDAVHSRSMLVMLFIWASMIFAGSFAQMTIAALDNDQIAAAVANLLTIMLYAFCGILASPSYLPRFWIFMYRMNPFTYLVAGLLSTSIGEAAARCAANEYLRFEPPANQTCGEYMASYIEAAGGYLLNPGTVLAGGNGQTGLCEYCRVGSTDEYLDSIGVSFATRWRDLGILLVFVVFNIATAMGVYWAARVARRNRK